MEIRKIANTNYKLKPERVSSTENRGKKVDSFTKSEAHKGASINTDIGPKHTDVA